MTRSSSSPGSADGRIGPQVSDEAVQRLADAVAHLAADGAYFVQALTETVLAMRPVLKNRLTKQEEDFLIESGTFTAETLAATQREVDRGGLQLGAAEAFLSHLHATMSLDNVTGFLKWDEEAVRAAVSEGRLYAIEISGQLRFPVWQFSLPGSPGKLLPGLAEVIEAVTPRWGWTSVAGFMATAHRVLSPRGARHPSSGSAMAATSTR